MACDSASVKIELVEEYQRPAHCEMEPAPEFVGIKLEARDDESSMDENVPDVSRVKVEAGKVKASPGSSPIPPQDGARDTVQPPTTDMFIISKNVGNPGHRSIPGEFLCILNDEELDSDDGDVVEDIEDEQDTNLDFELENLNLRSGSEIFILQDDGSLAPYSYLTRHPGVDATLDPDLLSSCSDGDEEVELSRKSVLRAVSPITPRVASPNPYAGDAPVPSSGNNGRGINTTYRTARRGRVGRGGRERGGAVASGERRRRLNWSRGEPLLEVYTSNEELPATLRDEIERLTCDRDKRTRLVNREVAEESDGESECFGNEEFVWESMDGWNGVKETFLPKSTGPTRAFENAYDAFRSFWDDSILSHIVLQTNIYAQSVQSARFRRDWYDTNTDEILILFAFWMMMGIIHMPTIKSCFSKLPILRTEIFRNMFSEGRYWNLNRAFHLANGSRDANASKNPLHPMGPIIEQLNVKFKQNYVLHQDICIDESLTLWKGPLGFKQIIRTKAAQFGIKTYQLCESSTGYLWSYFVYTGRNTTWTLPSSVSTVIKLVQPLLNLGHVLYTDNWFNSPTLARYLKRRKTDCVGTLRACRLNVPVVVQRTPLAECEFIARQAGDVMVVALQDRKRITCISTFHGVTQVHRESRHGQYKLKLIHDYNRGIGGVDRLDQMLEPYLLERKQCKKWTRKLFKRLLNVTVQNARILLEKSSDTSIASLSFRLTLVQSIIDRHRNSVPQRNPQNRPPGPRITYAQFPEGRLTERHFIRRTPITAEMRASVRHASNLGRRQCVWCTANGRRASKTAYECASCKVALCLDFCFEQFHTIP